jgi:predicted GIY-YIG superfamily endonuclease
VTPNSDYLTESAQAFAAQMKTGIAAEKELKARLRREKTRIWREHQPAAR